MTPANPSLEAAPLISDWLDLSQPGIVLARTGKAELGQGIATALLQIVADALSVEPAQVRLAPPSTDGPDERFTNSSLSIQHSGGALHAAASHARELFTEAATRRLGADVTVADGRFSSTTDSVTYADLADDVDLGVPIRMPDVRQPPTGAIGADTPRVDLADKVLGHPRFVQDMRLPGMRFARMVRRPARGATLIDVDADPAMAIEGVQDVFHDGNVLAVIAVDEISAIAGAAVLKDDAEWDLPESSLADAHATEFLTTAPTDDTVVADGPEVTEPTLAARYTRPFLAHGSIGPACAIAQEIDGHLTVWSHTQGVHPLRRELARALNRAPDSITVHHVEGAGCYGHNPADDVAYDAALLATRRPGAPIQVTWSREDELGWSPFGPAMAVDLAATADTTGQITAWSWDGYGNGHLSRPGLLDSPALLAFEEQEDGIPIPPAVDPPAVRGFGTARNALPGYDVGSVRAVSHRVTRMPLRTSAMRSLGSHLNVFAIESHLDDLARHHGIDTLEYRLRHLADPRGRDVLETVARQADWGSPLPDGHGRGLGYARYKSTGAWCAVVVEVEAVSSVRVTGVWAAVDVGRIVSPDGVANQIEGGILQSLSWTLMERVRFADGRVVSDTWEQYPILGFADVPPVHVTLLDRPDEPWLGSGEAATGPTAAALGNAVCDAVGVRVRDLPITHEAIVAAMDR